MKQAAQGDMPVSRAGLKPSSQSLAKFYFTPAAADGSGLCYSQGVAGLGFGFPEARKAGSGQNTP